MTNPVKQSEFKRNLKVEHVYNDIHGYKPEVYYKHHNFNEYTVLIKYKGIEAYITETMKRGLTDKVKLAIGDLSFNPKTVREAENIVNAYMRGVKVDGDLK